MNANTNRVHSKKECPICHTMITVSQFDKHVGTKSCRDIAEYKETGRSRPFSWRNGDTHHV